MLQRVLFWEHVHVITRLHYLRHVLLSLLLWPHLAKLPADYMFQKYVVGCRRLPKQAGHMGKHGKSADLFNSCLQFCIQPHLSNIRFLQNQPLAWAMPLQIGCTSWSSVLAIFKASLCSLNLHVICVGRVSRNHTTGLLSTIQILHNLGGHWVR